MLDGLYEAHLPAGLQGQTVPALTERRHGAVWKYCVVEEVVVLLQYYTLSILTQLSLTFNIRAIWFRANNGEMLLLYICFI